MRKSRIQKTINRKIQTAKFEQLDFNITVDEEIEWETVKERMEKTENVTKILIIDFMKSYDKIIAELKINRALAIGTKPVGQPVKNGELDDFDIV